MNPECWRVPIETYGSFLPFVRFFPSARYFCTTTCSHLRLSKITLEVWMPDRRFVRRRNRIPDQQCPVSTQEQARLLNDPALPSDNVHRTTSSPRASGGDTPTEPIHQTGQMLLENDRQRSRKACQTGDASGPRGRLIDMKLLSQQRVHEVASQSVVRCSHWHNNKQGRGLSLSDLWFGGHQKPAAASW
jgi:hypothetical protein